MATTATATSLAHGTTPRARFAVPAQVADQGRSNSTPVIGEDEQELHDETGRAKSMPSEGALPSARATAVARETKKETRKRLFPTVNYKARVSYFDKDSKYNYHDFEGLFVFVWLGLGIMVITAMLRNLKETGSVLSFRQLPLFKKDLVELGICDLIMCLSIMVSLPLHQLYRSGPEWLRWSKGGFYVQSIFQLGWLAFWCGLPYARDWTWTAQVFFTLHLMTMAMKLHSYAWYNGHLATTFDRLHRLDQAKGNKPIPVAIHYPAADARPLARRASSGVQEVAAIQDVRQDLAMELTSPLGNVTYPSNLTYANFWDFVLCPTLCYELEYPRTDRIDYKELLYKAAAVFGCVFLLIVVADEHIIPVLSDATLTIHRPSITLTEQALILAETVSRLLWPFLICFILTFLTIFEYFLGFAAELTCFADRQFYTDWWNSSDWLSFSSKWNAVVSRWLNRHVYSASQPFISKQAALLVTFLLSALLHEVIMIGISRKMRGYGAFLMCLQIPLSAMQRSSWGKRTPKLQNVLLLSSLSLGPALLCSLYVLA